MGEPPPSALPDGFALVSDHLRPLEASLQDHVGSQHPVLSRVAQQFFELAGKRFRPTLVLLASSAAAGGADPSASQCRLAEITEMIHAASLLHDDVMDVAETRRGARAAQRMFGNKLAVLAGDFLLARASVLLSRLNDVRVVELIATTIEETVQGELMQAKALPDELLELDHYLDKTYRKTAALMSLSCQASARPTLTLSLILILTTTLSLTLTLSLAPTLVPGERSAWRAASARRARAASIRPPPRHRLPGARAHPHPHPNGRHLGIAYRGPSAALERALALGPHPPPSTTPSPHPRPSALALPPSPFRPRPQRSP